MRVLLIVHVGETFGHLARALSITRELLARNCTVEIASAPRAERLVIDSGLRCSFRPVRWDWSHNSSELDGLSSDFLSRILETTEDLTGIVRQARPDFILGMPGFASTQIARYYNIPHASVIHGTHLAPLIELSNPTAAEQAVINLARRICFGPLNNAFQVLNRIYGLPLLDYQSYIDSETIFIPQPGLPFRERSNMFTTSFARGTLGSDFDGNKALLDGACYVTFGSGNPCDITRVLRLTRKVFTRVVTNTGRLDPGDLPDGVITRPYIASTSLMGRVAAVVSHGGIGTVGTFAERGIPQLIIPTEIDQASMAVHAARAAIARSVGLESFTHRKQLGRQLPEFSDMEFLTALEGLRGQAVAPSPALSSGAEEIAEAVISLLGTQAPPEKPDKALQL